MFKADKNLSRAMKGAIHSLKKNLMMECSCSFRLSILKNLALKIKVVDEKRTQSRLEILTMKGLYIKLINSVKIFRF